MGLPIPERKILTGTEWYLKHWSCTVFEEIMEYGGRWRRGRLDYFGFFFFLGGEIFGLGLCSCSLFYFSFGLCCTCDIEEDGSYKEGEGVSGRNSEK